MELNFVLNNIEFYHFFMHWWLLSIEDYNYKLKKILKNTMPFFKKEKFEAYKKANITIISGAFTVNMDEDINSLQDPYVWFKISGK